MPVLNLTRKTWLATTVRKADQFLTRLVCKQISLRVRDYYDLLTTLIYR